MKRTRVLGSLLVAALLSLAMKCDDGAKRTILVLNDLQERAATAYEGAAAEERAAGIACADAAQRKGYALHDPATEPQAARNDCQVLARPLPYDPAALEGAAAPINAAFGLVRVADEARRAVAAGTGTEAVLQKAIADAALGLLDAYTQGKSAGLRGIDPAQVAQKLGRGK